MTKHSPAPWEIGSEYGDRRDEIVDSEGRTLAVVWTRRAPPGASARPQFKDDEVLRGNLRLMRAAPELLEALRDVQRYFDALDEMQPDRKRGTEGARIREAVRDVIAKATQE